MFDFNIKDVFVYLSFMSLKFSDLKNYNYISNQLTGTLIGPNGDVVWLCLPRFDSDPEIAYLLDESKGGFFNLLPLDQFSSDSKYISPNVLRTDFKTLNGTAEVIDFLTPGKPVFVKEINSKIKLKLAFRPLFNFDQRGFVYSEDGNRAIFDGKNGKGRLVLEINGKYSKKADYTWELEAGIYDIVLSYYKNAEAYELESKSSTSNLSKALEYTINYWKTYLDRIKLSLKGGPLEGFEQLFRSSIILMLGLVYSPTGGIVAAPTASLPEDPSGNRNWDYRYVWVRDSSITASALCSLGFETEGRRALEFLFSMIDYSGKPFYNLYRADGVRVYGEKYIEAFQGFMNSKPVRIGNGATNQIQLDIEGEFLYAVKRYYESTGDKEFLQNHLKAIEYIADWLSDNWELADSGIWERPDDQNYTHSKAMIWVALDTAGKLVKEIGGEDRWSDTRKTIRNWVLSNCVSDGNLVTFPGSKEVDSTVLSFPIYGFMSVNDPLFLRTLKTVEKTLVINGFVYRYTSDTIGKVNHAFALCSMWLSSIYSKLGRKQEAIKIIENVKSIVGPNNLIGEDIDISSKTFTGNFPQGFVHGAFIRAVLDVLKS